jgi:hypothetical protein
MRKAWFGPKAMGHGVTPASWQGWLATALLIAVVTGSRFVPYARLGLPHWSRPALLGGVLLGYLALAWATYDSGA